MSAGQEQRPGLVGRYSIEDGRGMLSSSSKLPDFETLLASGASVRVKAGTERDLRRLEKGNKSRGVKNGKEAAARDIERAMEDEEILQGRRNSEDEDEGDEEEQEEEQEVEEEEEIERAGMRTVRAGSKGGHISLVDQIGPGHGTWTNAQTATATTTTTMGRADKALPPPPLQQSAVVQASTTIDPATRPPMKEITHKTQSGSVKASTSNNSTPAYDLSGGVTGTDRETQVARSVLDSATTSNSDPASSSIGDYQSSSSSAPSSALDRNGLTTGNTTSSKDAISDTLSLNPANSNGQSNSLTPLTTSIESRPRARAGIILSESGPSSRRTAASPMRRQSSQQRQEMLTKQIPLDSDHDKDKQQRDTASSSNSVSRKNNNSTQRASKPEDSVRCHWFLDPTMRIDLFFFSLSRMQFGKQVDSSKGPCFGLHLIQFHRHLLSLHRLLLLLAPSNLHLHTSRVSQVGI